MATRAGPSSQGETIWWGEDDHDLFRMYINQNVPKELMDIVRARYEHFRKNAIMFFKAHQPRGGGDI